MRVQTVRSVVLRVLQPRDYSFVLLAKVPSHQRRFTHNHHVLDRQGSTEKNVKRQSHSLEEEADSLTDYVS